jgi:hypothetical protein
MVNIELYKLLLWIISLIHIFIVLSVLCVPLTTSNLLLCGYSVLIPFMVFHWVVNDNTCFLTFVEKNIRKQLGQTETEISNCFTCRLINPIYDFVKNNIEFSTLIYFIVIFLWLICIYKIYRKIIKKEITNIYDAFTHN